MATYNNEFFVKTGDLKPDLEATLYDADDAVINLTGYTVAFSMQPEDSTTDTITAASCDIVVAASGTVKYEWQAADVATAGTYKGEFIITDGSGNETTFPRRENDPYLTIIIKDSI